ncbi:hypothetical protein [Microbacterium rhizomatis]|uniref:Uncharacterized protein n=1 Tax=Microbacterium rhizomatis TaxID=1631477 RepID=A0A5J5J1B7_9MICO|nr:hypothetical protein [Microbacterium rhizomatis]KAA9108265.1 hypothetical protein F6B43_12780 [Microbacterium rhizomatis]
MTASGGVPVEPRKDPAKRPAYEPAARLMQPVVFDPQMKRPVTTVAGALLVLLRVIAGALVLVDLSFNWKTVAAQVDPALSDGEIPADVASAGLTVVIVFVGAVLLLDLVLGFFTYRGSNLARVIVMAFSVISISFAFINWWFDGQEITLKTSFVSLAFDILVLLALSSRSAAAYARRNERR